MPSVLQYTPTTIEKFVQKDLSRLTQDHVGTSARSRHAANGVRESDAPESTRASPRSRSSRAWIAVYASVFFFLAGVILGYVGRDYQTVAISPSMAAAAHEHAALRIDYELQRR